MKKIFLTVCLVVTLFVGIKASDKRASSSDSPMSIINLCGNWELTGYSPDNSKNLTLIGTVPGQVHPDLQRAGLIPDPFWRNQADQCQWPENWEWRYKRTFDLPENFSQKWVTLQFDGLDTYATVILNGKQIAKTQDMFLPYEFDISGWLKPKNNVLEVRFSSPTKMVEEKVKKKSYVAAFDPSGYRVYIRRMQCTFGWDWVNRFVSMGIWKPCRIVSYQKGRIDDVFAYTKEISTKEATLSLAVTTTMKEKAGEKVVLSVMDPENKIVWQKTASVDSSVMKFEANIKNPQLWWPNGAGAHPLYQVNAVLIDASGNELHHYQIETGIRTIAIEEIPDQDKKGRSFTIVVNGRRIFAKGGNWVPADPFPSRITADKYDLILGQARDAGMNMLRSWGGGIYEPKAFWHACNKMGIMVSQDFLLACGGYPDDQKEFVDLLKTEFVANIKMERNNPSLIFWCGDNELGLGSGHDDGWACKTMQETMTKPLVNTMDPSRPFRITSPWGGEPNNSMTAGDCHINAEYSDEIKNGDMKNYRSIIDFYSGGRFMSEHAAAGAPPKSTLLKFMTEEDLKGSEMFEYHTKDNPYAPGSQTLFQVVERCATKLYGDPGDDVDRRVRQMGYVQYDFVRLAMESSRRRKFYTSGIQFWMYNDCWPASGWSLVDYWGGRKAGWYAMASGSKPVIAASQVEGKTIKWWVCSDLYKTVNVDVELKVQPVDGSATWIKRIHVKVPANSSITAISLPLEEIKSKLGDHAVLVCDLNYEGGSDRSWWTAGLPKDISFQKTKLTVTQQRDDDHGEVTIHANKWARVVTLEADVDFEDNYFEMLPGETRTIKWKSHTGPFEGKIAVCCWNQ